MRVEKQLILTFVVSDAPPDASSEIPLFLKDDKGNQWSFTTSINVNNGVSSLPKAFSLSQNTPNPFNPSTNISYAVPEGDLAQVSLKVYDVRGRLIRTLVESVKEAGTYNVFWDGSDENGRTIASGVYFYRMKAGSFDQTRKMVVLK